jgi:hypothetical protein
MLFISTALLKQKSRLMRIIWHYIFTSERCLPSEDPPISGSHCRRWAKVASKSSMLIAFAMKVFFGVIYQCWIDAGRPSHYDTRLAITESSGGTYFEFTNTIVIGGKTYHCRFAFRPGKPGPATYLPPGTLAMTDEDVMLWIRERDGRVFVSPDRTGIEP